MPNLPYEKRNLPYGISEDLGVTKFVGAYGHASSSKIQTEKIAAETSGSRAAYNARRRMPGSFYFLPVH